MTDKPVKQKGDVLRCSFCNKSQRDVKKLIAGPTVYICDECVDICLDIIAEDRRDEVVADGSPVPPQILFAADTAVPGQVQAKRLVAAVVTEHASRSASSTPAVIGSSALLLAGPTGTGKLELVKSIVGASGLPLAIIDVPLLFPDAPFQAKHEFRGFEEKPGVIVLNHIEAVAMRGNQKEELRLVQHSLISILDGAIVRLAGEKNSVAIDTSRILFIGIGTFTDLPMASAERFGAEVLIRQGFMPELVARFGVMLMLEPLGGEILKEALTRQHGLMTDCIERFKRYGLTVTFAPTAVDAIVRLGERRKTGLRGLKAIMDSLALALACEPLPEGEQAFEVDEGFVVRNLA